MKSILDPTFVYTSSINTNLRDTFAKFREEKAAKGREQAADQQKVRQIFDQRNADGATERKR